MQAVKHIPARINHDFGMELRILCRMKAQIIAAEKNYGIGSSMFWMIALLPFIIVFIFCTFLLYSPILDLVLLTLNQNNLVDLFTFVFLIAGGILGIRLVMRIKKYKAGIMLFLFYLAFSVGVLYVGMEEISWGQLANGFESSSELGSYSRQEGTTIKNVRVWRDHLEVLPLTIGLIGLLSVWTSKIPYLWKISSPMILLPWFVVIIVFSAIDLFHDFYVIYPKLDNLVDNLEEVIELLIGISGFLFIWLNTRKFSRDPVQKRWT